MIFETIGWRSYGVAPVVLIVALIILALLYIINILMSVIIYKNAVSKGLNAELWLLIMLLTGLTGWIIYFIVRNERRPDVAPIPKKI